MVRLLHPHPTIIAKTRVKMDQDLPFTFYTKGFLAKFQKWNLPVKVLGINHLKQRKKIINSTETQTFSTLFHLPVTTFPDFPNKKYKKKKKKNLKKKNFKEKKRNE